MEKTEEKKEGPTALSKMVESAFVITSHVSTHRRELCQVLVAETEGDGEKINQIRKSILKYRSQALSLEPKELPEADRAAFHLKMGPFLSSIAPKQTPEVTVEFFSMMSRPLEEHSRLLEQIAAIIRSGTSDDKKIEMISNFLL